MLTLRALALLAFVVCAHADSHLGRASYGNYLRNGRSYRSLELPSGCLYDGRWFKDGAPVPASDACLRCACAHGALACTRRACAAPPDPPPPRCHLRYRKGACCPELHCPDGITMMEHSASARLERDDFEDIAKPISIAHACVEGGAIYTAGSAMASRAACETCFCLGGGRRCVRPRCLPAPPGCTARPTIGACCPTRYYCDHQLLDFTSSTTVKPKQRHVHDCRVDGKWISEGERVVDSRNPTGANCTICFCLRGKVMCQPLACAPPLHGCSPLIRPGQCCPHQYICPHHNTNEVVPHRSRPASDNSLTFTKYDNRSLLSTRMTTQETTTKSTTKNIETTNNLLIEDKKTSLISTTKVKRKTSDPPTTISGKAAVNVTKTTTEKTHTTFAAKLISSTTEVSTTEVTSDTTSTEQPESSVRITVNGTINCTTELTSTTVSLNATNATVATIIDAQPRVPFSDIVSNPNDIITDRTIITDYDDNDSFTINVTSSLNTNKNHSTKLPTLTTVASIEKESSDIMNVTKKTKGEYDYDYTEPTLPPSLPNLKIIPFVAADAVVDENAPKMPLTYPLSEREDKYPIYYPTVATKEHAFASRREDVYNPTQYPIFVSKKVESVPYAKPTHEDDETNSELSKDQETAVKEFTVAAALGTRVSDSKRLTTKAPLATTFKVETPAVNLFSPPVETEGGFIPKGPGIIDEYYAVYPSTHAPLNLPHLTTSMQLNTVKESTCLTTDGRPVPEGETIDIACSVCSCAWGELHCISRPCNTPEGCHRRPASNSQADICCGEIVCDKDINSTSTTTPATTIEDEELEYEEEEPEKIPTPIISDIIPFDPPPDRSVPETNEKIDENKFTTRPNKITETTTTKIDPVTSVTTNTTITDKIHPEETNNKTVIEEVINKTSTAKPIEKPVTSTEAVKPFENSEEVKESQSQEYDEEEEDDEGFSFGSILKLLLSETYNTTTASPSKKKPPVSTTTQVTTTTTQATTTTTKKLSTKPTMPPFAQIPHQPYLVPQKPFPHQTVNKIDHLVLGEATAIKKATPRPNPLKPGIPVKQFTKPTRKPFTTAKPLTTTSTYRPLTSTYRPITTTYRLTTSTYRPVTKPQITDRFDPVIHEERPPGFSPNLANNNALPGVLKLAGCNIYGRMYRVGRIIAELSTACQECRCTEFGVQCRPLDC